MRMQLIPGPFFSPPPLAKKGTGYEANTSSTVVCLAWTMDDLLFSDGISVTHAQCDIAMVIMASLIKVGSVY